MKKRILAMLLSVVMLASTVELTSLLTGTSPAYAHTLVVNYAGLSPAALPEAMDLLAEIFGA